MESNEEEPSTYDINELTLDSSWIENYYDPLQQVDMMHYELMVPTLHEAVGIVGANGGLDDEKDRSPRAADPNAEAKKKAGEGRILATERKKDPIAYICPFPAKGE